MSLQELKETHDFVVGYLRTQGGLSEATTYEQLATKSLLIAAAGDLEKKFTKLLVLMPQSHGSPEFIVEFFDAQAIRRRYHTMFDWKSKNINQFAGYFGGHKKREILERFATEDNEIIKNFMFIGAERNRIVHNGLATESLNHTFNEVWDKYQSAILMIEVLSDLLLKQTDAG